MVSTRSKKRIAPRRLQEKAVETLQQALDVLLVRRAARTT